MVAAARGCRSLPTRSRRRVIRQTGAEVIVPPNPGTVGACGIALLAREALPQALRSISRGSSTRVERKDTFVCRSTEGLRRVEERVPHRPAPHPRRRRAAGVLLGGGCSITTAGPAPGSPTVRRILPRAGRAGRVGASADGPHRRASGRARGGVPAEGAVPFFARFFRALDFDVVVTRGGGREALRRGTEGRASRSVRRYSSTTASSPPWRRRPPSSSSFPCSAICRR